MMELLADPAVWVSFGTLAVLEIVLGIDNIIFISIIAERLPEHRRQAARVTGLLLALVMRIALLLSITWIIKLTAPVFTVFGHDMSWKDIILFCGGLFLLAKATYEIHETVEGDEMHVTQKPRATASFAAVIVQILALDAVFSLDSILTAVGLTDHIPVMIAAIVLAMAIMIAAAEPVADFVSRHLSIKMLALAFLVLIGAVLVADGLGLHIERGYIYSSIGFSLAVQFLIMLARKRKTCSGAPATPPPTDGA